MRAQRLHSHLCTFWQYQHHLHTWGTRYYAVEFLASLDKLTLHLYNTQLSHLIKMSAEMQVWFQANGSLLCLHSSDSTDVGGCKAHSVWPWHTLFTSPDSLSLKRSTFSPQSSGSPHPSIITCLPLVTLSFSYAGSSVYLLNFEWKPNGQKHCTEFYILFLAELPWI